MILTFLLIAWVISPRHLVFGYFDNLTMTPLARLANDLNLIRLATYGVHKPTRNPMQTIKAELYFDILTFIHLDERSEALTVVPDLKLNWNDEFLRWNPLDYSNITELVVDPDIFEWKPRAVHFNNAQDIYTFARSDPGDAWTLNLHSNGEVVQFPTRQTVTTMCMMDFRYFPFDLQRCSFDFGLLEPCRDVELVNAGFRRNPANSVSTNSIWEIYDFRVENASKTSCATFKVAIQFTILLQRKPLPFVFNTFIPLAFLTLIQLATVAIPADSNDRATYSVTVQLAFGVMQTNINSLLPFSAHLSFMEILIMCQMGASTMMTCYACVTTYLFKHWVKQEKPSPIEQTMRMKALKRSDMAMCFAYIFFVGTALVVILITMKTAEEPKNYDNIIAEISNST